MDFVPSDAGTGRMRLAVIGSHRSGTTWVRSVLGGMFGLEQIAIADPAPYNWDSLPQRCVLQMHYYPVDWFLKRLHDYDFKVVITARHPFDILTSWLNYNYYVHQEGYCPGGGACPECSIIELMPRSDEFIAYAGGESGRLLLCYSPAWWQRDGVSRVRYEDMVNAPEPTLTRLISELGASPVVPLDEILHATAIETRKGDHASWHYHYWQGRPGLWRDMFPADVARRLHARIPEPFRIIGYECDPDETLDPVRADLNWLRLQLASTREHLKTEHAKHRKSRTEIAGLQGEIQRLMSVPSNLPDQLGTIHANLAALASVFNVASHDPTGIARELAETKAELASMKERFGPYQDLGPRALRFAQRTKRLAKRFVA